jgi:hypothetical protein
MWPASLKRSANGLGGDVDFQTDDIGGEMEFNGASVKAGERWYDKVEAAGRKFEENEISFRVCLRLG